MLLSPGTRGNELQSIFGKRTPLAFSIATGAVEDDLMRESGIENKDDDDSLSEVA